MTLYTPKTSAEIRADFLSDIELECLTLGIEDPPIQPGTDWWLLGTAISKLGLVAYANIEARDAATSELTATGDDLDDIREALGLPLVEGGPATGKIRLTVDGTRTVEAGRELLIAGIRYAIQSTTVGVVDGAEVDVYALDNGTAGNQPGGTEIKFMSAPLGISETAQVSYSVPLRGGVDAEDVERKRTRIFNARRYKPESSSGTVGHLRDTAFSALASIQGAYVYGALGGPSSCLLVVSRAFDRANNNYSRVVDDAAVAIVRAAIHAAVFVPAEHVVRSVADQAVNVSIQVTIPDSILIGGRGNGWADASPWPALYGGDTRCTVTSVAGNELTLNAATTTTPLEGLTRIAWWSLTDQRFYVYTIMAQSGSAGAWVLTLDRAMVDSLGAAPTAGEYVSPAMVNGDGYGTTWLAGMEALGPSEMTTDANRLPRAARDPDPSVESPTDIGALMLKRLVDHHAEISDYAFAYRSVTTPTVPATVDLPPNVLVPGNLGIYPL